MPSKKERQQELAQIWATPTPFDIDFFDKGNEIVVTTSYKGDVIGWWLGVLKALYPDQTYREKSGIIKIKPSPGVGLKLNKKTGLMKIGGKSHWPWVCNNFIDILEQGNADAQELDDIQSVADSVTRYLQLDKNVEEVLHCLYLICLSIHSFFIPPFIYTNSLFIYH